MTTVPDARRVKDVLEAEERRCKAVEQENWNVLDSLLAEGFVYTHSTGKTENKTEWIQGIQTRRRAIVRDNLGVRIFGDVALVSGTSVNRYVEPFIGDSHFGVLLDVLQVWVNENGAWRLVANHGVKKVDG